MVLVRSWTCACAESRAKRRVLAHPASSCAAPAARPAQARKLCLTAAASRPAPTLLENCVSRPLRHGRPQQENCISRPLRHDRSRLCWKTASRAALRHGVASGRPRKLFLKQPCVTARRPGQQKLSLSVFSSWWWCWWWCRPRRTNPALRAGIMHPNRYGDPKLVSVKGRILISL